MSNGIKTGIKDVIRDYEVGLTTYLINKKIKAGAYYSSKTYFGEFNPSLFFIEKLIIQGIPLIKKKIIFWSFRKDELFTLMRMKFNPDPEYYIDLIRKSNPGIPLIDFNRVPENNNNGQTTKSIRKFRTRSLLFEYLRRLNLFKYR